MAFWCITRPFEAHLQALGATDPIGLHGAHFFRPTLKLLNLIQQVFSIMRDAEEPLHELALLSDFVIVGKIEKLEGDNLWLTAERNAPSCPDNRLSITMKPVTGGKK